MNRSELIYEKLKELLGSPKCELTFHNDYELLISVILSAQCTDKRVNIVAKELYRDYPTATDLANAKITDIERIVKSCGMYHQKSNNIIKASKSIVENFNGIVPNNRPDLISLSGVGQKTANVVLAIGNNIPAIPVDTHVFRVARRLDLSSSNTPKGVEKDLCETFPIDKWIDTGNLFVIFGRYYCKAQSPQCSDCVLKDICRWKKENYDVTK